MPFDVPTCRTFPFNVNGGVCVVVVVDGVGDVALGLQPTIAPQRAMTLNTRRSLMKGISESNVPSTWNVVLMRQSTSASDTIPGVYWSQGGPCLDFAHTVQLVNQAPSDLRTCKENLSGR